MPLMVRIRSPTAPAESYLHTSASIYENVDIPFQDFKKEFQDEVAQPCAEEPEVIEEFTREVPYYAEEEAFPEVLVCDEVAPAVDMPDMMHEMQFFYPRAMTTRWIPPPPPAHSAARSVDPMHFWHARLLAHPLYASCCRLAGYPCPVPQETTNDWEWAACCGKWWETLSTVMRQRDVSEITPARSWNPYNLLNNVRFHEIRHTCNPRCAQARVFPEAARFPVPPPPEHALFTSEYGAMLGQTQSDCMYVQALTRWWRLASEWTAATAAAERPWVCPPPTTSATPAAWGAALEQWRSLTLQELKAEDERVTRQRDRGDRSHAPSQALTPRLPPTAAASSSCGPSLPSFSLEGSTTHPSLARAQQLW